MKADHIGGISQLGKTRKHFGSTLPSIKHSRETEIRITPKFRRLSYGCKLVQRRGRPQIVKQVFWHTQLLANRTSTLTDTDTSRVRGFILHSTNTDHRVDKSDFHFFDSHIEP